MTRTELAALVGAMTEGPWEIVVVGDTLSLRRIVAIGTAKGWTPKDIPDADAAGIVALRNHAEKLLAVCEAAERVDGFLNRACVWGPEIDTLRAALRDLEGA